MKKRFLSLFLVIMLVGGMFFNVDFVSKAAEVITTSDGWMYEVEEGAATVVGYEGSETDMVIPTEVDGYPVKTIGNYAFQWDESITSLVIPSNINRIGYSAFEGCTKLVKVRVESENVSAPSGLVVFEDCIRLKTVEFAEGLTRIPGYLFEKVASLEEVIIPASVIVIGNSAFEGTGLKTVDLPSSVEDIRSLAFAECESLVSVKLPANLKKLSNSFVDCPSLKTINIPKDLETSKYSPFEGCTNLTDVTFSEDTTVVNKNLLKNSGVTEITLPEGVATIEKNAFEGCENLETISLPETLETISEEAFLGCESLDNVDIPDSVTDIGERAFKGCSSLSILDISSGLKQLQDEVFANCTSLKEVDIPNSIKKLGENWSSQKGVFNGCTSLENVSLSSKLEVLGSRTFEDCISLKEVELPSTISVLSPAFSGCASLERISIPYGISSISGETFDGCIALTEITIPSTLSNIPDETFDSCNELTIRCVEGSVADEFAKGKGIATEYITEIISIATSNVKGINKNFVYTGKAIKPSITVTCYGKKLVEGTDYTVRYENNVNVGEATITISGVGSYVGSLVKTFDISPKKIISDNVKLSKTSYSYNGKVKKPSVSVTISGKKLVKGVDYKVTYSNQTIGKILVKIEGIGNYQGTVKKYFTIQLDASKVTRIQSSSRKVKLSYSKGTGTQKYQIYYSTKKNSGYKKLATVTGTSYQSKKLVKDKTYYFKVKGYRKVNGKTYYSDFSNIKKIKVK